MVLHNIAIMMRDTFEPVPHNDDDDADDNQPRAREDDETATAAGLAYRAQIIRDYFS